MRTRSLVPSSRLDRVYIVALGMADVKHDCSRSNLHICGNRVALNGTLRFARADALVMRLHIYTLNNVTQYSAKFYSPNLHRFRLPLFGCDIRSVYRGAVFSNGPRASISSRKYVRVVTVLLVMHKRFSNDPTTDTCASFIHNQVFDR